MQSQTPLISLSHALAMLVLDNNMADILYDAYTHTCNRFMALLDSVRDYPAVVDGDSSSTLFDECNISAMWLPTFQPNLVGESSCRLLAIAANINSI